MRHFNRFLAPVAVYLALAGFCNPASANLVQYSYTGNPFTQISAGFPVSRVFINFTVDDALIVRNGHVNLDSYNSKNLSGYFYFSNGYQTLSNDPYNDFFVYTSANISFDTDANGNVSGNWNASAGRAHGNLEGLILNDFIGSSPTLDTSSSLGGYSASVANNPGVWTRFDSSAVPLPGGFLLFGSALGTLCLRRCFKGREKLNA